MLPRSASLSMERRGVRGALLFTVCAVASLVGGCGAKSVPTSFYLTVTTKPAVPVLDELRLSVYGDQGPLFLDQRRPSTGALTPDGPGRLGTVTIYVPAGVRHMRFDVRGLVAGAIGGEGTANADVVAGNQVPVTVLLDAGALFDRDGDGVPDPIDNCPTRANADQGDVDGNGVGDVCDTGSDGGASRDGAADGPPLDARPASDGAAQDVSRPDLGGRDVGPTPDSGVSDRAGPSDTPPPVDAASDTAVEVPLPVDVAPEARLGGLLSITTLADNAIVDLSAEGAIDWAQWGLSSSQSFNHKATGGGTISDLVTQPNPARYSNFSTQLSWSDGAPTTSASTTTGVYNTGGNAQQSITVVANNTTRTLRFYGGASNGNIRLTAHLSDGSVPDAIHNATGSGIYEWSAEISFRAASDGQTLTLTWTLSSTAGFPSTVSARGATLF